VTAETINFPVLRKVNGGRAQLTNQLIKYFSDSNRCIYDGELYCNPAQCVYRNEPDCFNLCKKCKLGFHLHCKAILEPTVVKEEHAPGNFHKGTTVRGLQTQR
jgi:hypothetical protein